MTKTNKMYFGTFSSYEEYYAIGSNPEEVKKLLWRMYANNFCKGSKPTKEDRRIFEEEATIEEMEKVEAFGYNTAYKECYTLKSNKLQRMKGKVIR